ncbi:hypothetical protein CF326_g6142 [Tilletia indica]|nr:hypothetical protein CF326_g6142 [Tilletia indica]
MVAEVPREQSASVSPSMTSVMVVVIPGRQNDGYIQASPLVAHRSSWQKPWPAVAGREGPLVQVSPWQKPWLRCLALRTGKRWLQPVQSSMFPSTSRS